MDSSYDTHAKHRHQPLVHAVDSREATEPTYFPGEDWPWCLRVQTPRETPCARGFATAEWEVTRETHPGGVKSAVRQLRGRGRGGLIVQEADKRAAQGEATKGPKQ